GPDPRRRRSAVRLVAARVAAGRVGDRAHAREEPAALPAPAAVGDRHVHRGRGRVLGRAAAARAGRAAARALRRSRLRRPRPAAPRAPGGTAAARAPPPVTGTAPELATARLTLRPAGPADVATLLPFGAAAGPPDAGGEARGRLLATTNAGRIADWGFGLWLLVDGERSIGWVGLRPRESREEPELYYGLAPDVRGHGFAREAVTAV